MVKTIKCSLRYENRLRKEGHRVIAGIDEAGRGPLAGPVVAAAVVLPPRFRHPVLTDSKKLTPAIRDTLFEEICAHPQIIWGIGVADVGEIDRLNILRANDLAMCRAVEALATIPCVSLIDGRPVKDFPWPQHALVKGDALSLSIAAASVLAKVHRDRLMVGYAETHPGYGFEKHKGYGTAAHLAALQRLGPCAIHRRSFAPVARCEAAGNRVQP